MHETEEQQNGDRIKDQQTESPQKSPTTSSFRQKSPMKKRGSEKKTLKWQDEETDKKDVAMNGSEKDSQARVVKPDDVEAKVVWSKEVPQQQRKLTPPKLLLVTTEEQLKEQVAAFKSDPKLMDAANKFVGEVIEKAKEEAAKRMKDKKIDPGPAGVSRGFPKHAPWYRRAQGYVYRIFNCICLCTASQDNS